MPTVKVFTASANHICNTDIKGANGGMTHKYINKYIAIHGIYVHVTSYAHDIYIDRDRYRYCESASVICEH